LKRKRMIRLPAHAAGIQRKLLQAAKEYREQMGTDPTHEELLELVDASETVVKATLASGQNIVSLDQPSGRWSKDGSPADTKNVGDFIEDTNNSSDPFYNVAAKELMGIVRTVLKNLSEKETAILRLRFGLFDEDNVDRSEYPVTAAEATGLERGEALI